GASFSLLHKCRRPVAGRNRYTGAEVGIARHACLDDIAAFVVRLRRYHRAPPNRRRVPGLFLKSNSVARADPRLILKVARRPGHPDSPMRRRIISDERPFPSDGDRAISRSEPAMPKVLLIEDDRETAEEIIAEFEALGFDVTWAATGIDGLDQARSGDP